ncbi:hypothetical protein SHKM778_48110 [Streptomyces sp. KM77-8]|uniref:Carrier domain-containing protein n=1 Tax=Streptomyces haneummycinicus TaxID=3074435 RepID=A0AAT9HMD6_9ACTN
MLKKPVDSVEDNFFELGGHSLVATQVVSMLRKETGLRLSMRLLFAHPTVSALAAELDRLAAARETAPRRDRTPTGPGRQHAAARGLSAYPRRSPSAHPGTSCRTPRARPIPGQVVLRPKAGSMPTFAASDGTGLAYQVFGDGPPLVCVPGGPGRAGAYLAGLAGAVGGRSLVVLDNRGTGASEEPAAPESYRMERLVDDIEALRAHLGLERMDLLAHSSAGNTALLYALRGPERVARLVLLAPSTRAVGIGVDDFEEALARRADEDWYESARAGIKGWLGAPTIADSLPHREQAAPSSTAAGTRPPVTTPARRRPSCRRRPRPASTPTSPSTRPRSGRTPPRRRHRCSW